MSKTDDQIKKALKNIEDDRKITKELLDDAIKYVAVDEARHREVGIIMAKYVETLQRSNEQLVKVIGIMTKKESNQGLGSLDKDELFEPKNLYSDPPYIKDDHSEIISRSEITVASNCMESDDTLADVDLTPIMKEIDKENKRLDEKFKEFSEESDALFVPFQKWWFNL